MTYPCKKCGHPEVHNGTLGGTGPLAGASFTLTGFRCAKCGHWNNLKPRKHNVARTAKL